VTQGLLVVMLRTPRFSNQMENGLEYDFNLEELCISFVFA